MLSGFFNFTKTLPLATCIVLAAAWPATALAEYRVFLLRIENVQSKEVRFVPSTLDPIQYPRYHTVLASEQVTYSETWRCFGRTSDFADFCPNPRPAPTQIPAESPTQDPAESPTQDQTTGQIPAKAP